MFCHNINRDMPIVISNRNIMMHFYYIDDVIDSFISQLSGDVTPDGDGIFRLGKDMIIDITLGEMADALYRFREYQKAGNRPVFSNDTEKRLWETYISYKE